MLLRSLDPPHRNRLRDILRRPPETDDERDRRIRNAIAKFDHDYQAFKDALGIYDDEPSKEGGDDDPSL